MSEIVRVPFHNHVVLTVEHEGKPHIILKPAFEAIGLDADRQIAKIQRQPWAGTAVTAVPTAGGVQRMVIADVRTFLMALAVIPASRVSEAARPALIAYQREVADVIEAHFLRRREGREYDPVTWTWDETAAHIRQKVGLDLDQSQLIRQLKQAGVLKQTGAPRKQYRDLLWFTGSAWNVHPHAVPRLLNKLAETRQELASWNQLYRQLEIEGVGRNGVTA